jgi:hypothetical protein
MPKHSSHILELAHRGARHRYDELERFPIVRSTALMVLLSRGGSDGAVFEGLAHTRIGGP